MTLGPGVRLGGRYRLDVRIGAGGMGEVWRATDEVLRRTVAVKVMLARVAAEPGFAQRFLSEATAMARVNHPAVASVHDYGTDAGVTYLVMEFIDGESLADVLRRVGRLGPIDTMWLVTQVADGLHAVHAAGLVHRDIKPANLLIRRDGKVVVTDFGISWHEEASRLTAAGAILGTPSYLSPEQVLGHPLGPPSDVYALGLTAYECLAGYKPFEAENSYAVAIQRLQRPPRPIEVALPQPVLTVVQGALAVDPRQRWASAAAMAEAARSAAAEVAASGAGAPTPPPTSAPTAPPQAPAPGPTATPPAPAPTAVSTPLPQAPAHGSTAVFPASPPVLTLGMAGPPTGEPSASPSLGSALQGAGSSRRRGRGAVVVTFLAVMLVGAGIAIWNLTRGDAEPEATSPGSTGATPATSTVPAGFGACGAGLCPAEPMCWGGITLIAGKVIPPKRRDCNEEHHMQTFAAIPVPDGVNLFDLDLDALMKRADVRKACSPAVMRERSKDPAETAGWSINAWPIPTPPGGSVNYLHCVAGNGETRGAAF